MELRYFPLRLQGFIFSLSAVLCLLMNAFFSPSSDQKIEVWEEALTQTHASYQLLQGKEHNDSLRQILLNTFESDHPILTDWLKQDQSHNWTEVFEAQSLAEELSKKTAQVLVEIEKRGGNTASLQQKLAAVAPRLAQQPNHEQALTRLYLKACEKRRELRLKSLLNSKTPIVFSQHHNFKMSFIGYTEGLSDARHERFFKEGTRLVELTFDGLYGKTKTLIDDPQGLIRDVDVSPDGKKLLFAWKKSDRLDDYHLHEYNLNTGKSRQLTFGMGRADYEPIYLPDGDILFTSTRPEQSVPCWWTEISNLYRMSPGREIPPQTRH